MAVEPACAWVDRKQGHAAPPDLSGTFLPSALSITGLSRDAEKESADGGKEDRIPQGSSMVPRMNFIQLFP